MNRRHIYALVGGTSFGILFSTLFDISSYFLGFWLFFLSLIIFVFIIKFPQRGLILVLLFVASFGLGQMRFASVQEQFFDNNLDLLVETEVILSAQVVNFPEKRINSQRIVLALDDSPVRILAFIGLHEKIAYGDRVTLKGFLRYPDNFTTDLGKEFDYNHYLQVRNISYELSFPQIVSIDSTKGNKLIKFLFSIKNSFIYNLELFLPEPHASLASGILLGVKDSIAKNFEASFRRTGLIHIIVLSGYNVTIIADSLMKTFSFLPYYYGLSFGAISIVLFAIIVGGGPTVVRASIMALLALFARATGRLYDVTLALVVAAGLMIYSSPLILVYDVGFQLSFLATLGLIFLAPALEPYFKFLPKRLAFQEFFIATASAQIAVLPWLLYKVGELSLVALPVNVLVLPVIPLAMFFSFLTALTAFVFPWLALPLSYITFGFLDYILTVVAVFDSLPVVVLPIVDLSFILVIIMYLLIVTFIFQQLVWSKKH